MGERGPLPGPTSRSSHRKRKAPVTLAPVVQLPAPTPKIPTPPKGLQPATKRAWRKFWASPTAQVVSPEREPGLRRLFQLYDQRDRAWQRLEVAMFVTGSAQQIKLNPAGEFVIKLEEKILRLEIQYGLTPAAAARLLGDLGTAQRTLEDLKRRAAEGPGGEVDIRDHAIADDDPRLAPVELTPRDG